MDVIVNGETKQIDDGSTVAQLLAQLQLPGLVAVEVDRVIVPRAEHASFQLAPGAAIEIVHFVGGG